MKPGHLVVFSSVPYCHTSIEGPHTKIKDPKSLHQVYDSVSVLGGVRGGHHAAARGDREPLSCHQLQVLPSAQLWAASDRRSGHRGTAQAARISSLSPEVLVRGMIVHPSVDKCRGFSNVLEPGSKSSVRLAFRTGESSMFFCTPNRYTGG